MRSRSTASVGSPADPIRSAAWRADCDARCGCLNCL
jgi:hypothetical protein